MSAKENGIAAYTPPEDAVDISPKGDGGVLKQILKEGSATEGKPSPGDSVKVHYVGTLTDGTPFDSSRDRGEHFEFELGKGNVIKAWDIGIATMQKGEVCKLICASEYAYGKSGSPPKIPANATLIFEVELFSWKGEDLSQDKDGGIIRSILYQGKGYISPNEGSCVQVNIEGFHEGRRFESRKVEFELGDGVDQGVVSGVETALKKFKEGERSLLKLSAKHAFGAEGNVGFDVPPNADVEYRVTLDKFEKAKELWEMNFDEKYDQSKVVKDKGTAYFKEGKYDRALAKYKKVVDYLDKEPAKGEDDEQRKAILLAARLNMAMCSLKLNLPEEARRYCNEALEADSSNVKGLFRRGQSYMATSDWREAGADFQKALTLDPTNTAAKSQLAMAQKKLKEAKQKDKSTYGGMFDKFAARDAKVNDA